MKETSDKQASTVAAAAFMLEKFCKRGSIVERGSGAALVVGALHGLDVELLGHGRVEVHFEVEGLGNSDEHEAAAGAGALEA